MRLPNDQKRRQILAAAGRLFAAERFDKVKLDDIAAAAGVGKGTLYIYFRGKEDLYFCLQYEGFVALVDRLSEQLARDESPAIARLRRIVEGLADYAFAHPQVYELMRSVGAPKDDARWLDRRAELIELIRRTLVDGVSRGEFSDPHPELTALYVPGFVRSAMLFGHQGLEKQALVEHIFGLLCHGISTPLETPR